MSPEPHRYAPSPGRFDEAIAADGTVRPAWRAVDRVLRSPEVGALVELQRQADRLLEAEGTGHLVHDLSIAPHRQGPAPAPAGHSRPWRLDPVPFLLDAAEFERLAAAAVQRMRVIEALLADCYGERRLVASGVVPAELLFSQPAFRTVAGGPSAVRRWLTHYAVDLVRDSAGRWHVVDDATDAPGGLGYSLLNRAVLARLVPDALREAGAHPIHDHADVLRRALASAAPPDRVSPRTVVLTAGPASDTYVEQSYLAGRLGHHLVEGADLVMREGRLWLRALDGLEPIDVVYRRVEDAHLDPLEPGHVGGGAGVPGIVWGAHAGGLSLANAYGSALAASREVIALLPGVAQALLGESLVLDLLPTGTALATAPVFDRRSDSLRGRAVVLRLQVARVDDDHVVMRGGAGRVLAEGDSPAHPTAQVAKDVWVLGGSGGARRVVGVSPPQVDFGASVPKRVAASMFWLGRAAERAEVAARAAREVAQQFDEAPSLVALGDGAWARGVWALLRSAQGAPLDQPAPDLPAAEWVRVGLAATSRTVATQLASLVQEASSVREYLSVTTGRLLGRLAAAHARLVERGASADELDAVLVDLAALSGMAMESTVRGPSWRFLDLGRRVERALAVLGAVEATLGAAVPPMALQPLADALLAAHESLVAYRRRYRSDVDVRAVLGLLVHDDANPRSLAYQLDRLRDHTAGLAWTTGADLVQEASRAAWSEIDSTVVNGRRVTLDGLVLAVRAPLLLLADAVNEHWFADPVHPTVVRGQ